MTLGRLKNLLCNYHHKYFLPIKGSVVVPEMYDEGGMNYPREMDEERYDERVPLTEGSVVDALDPREDFLKGESLKSVKKQAISGDRYAEARVVERELYNRRRRCTSKCRSQTGIPQKGRLLMGTQKITDGAAPCKPCLCGAMYLPAADEGKTEEDQAQSAEEEAQGRGGGEGVENRVRKTHTIMLGAWNDHCFEEQEFPNIRERNPKTITKRNRMGLNRSMGATKRPGLLNMRRWHGGR